MKYYFEPEITEEEKLQIKTATSSIDNNVAIYVRNKKPHDKFSEIDTEDVFNKSDIIFFVSREVVVILPHLSSIIRFILDRKNNLSQYEICVDVIGKEFIKVPIVTKFITPYGYSHEFCPGYEIDIVNSNIMSFKNVHMTWDKLSKKYLMYEKYDLIDQYKDFTKCTSNSNKLINNILNTKESGKKVTVVNGEDILEIEFSNCDNFTDVTKYLIKTFGQGSYNYKVDMKTCEETIKYIIN